jgi:hypothetical protein
MWSNMFKSLLVGGLKGVFVAAGGAGRLEKIALLPALALRVRATYTAAKMQSMVLPLDAESPL